jgi:DNA-binding LytR/AlgR family response regulator
MIETLPIKTQLLMNIAINRKRRKNIPSHQIVMLRGEVNYTIFYLSNGKTITNPHTLKSFEILLQTEGFLRVHRAYLLNPAYMSSYDEITKSIVMKNGMNAQVARRRTGVMKEFLKRNSEFVEFVG